MITCPVCSEYEFEMDDNYEICTVCNWENDGLQLDEPDSDDGANEISLNEARAKWKARNAHHAPNRKPAYVA